MVKLASVVVAGLAFCVLANDSGVTYMLPTCMHQRFWRSKPATERVLNRRAYDKSQGLGGDGEKFNDKAVSHLRGGKKKSPAPMSRAKIFRIKMLNCNIICAKQQYVTDYARYCFPRLLHIPVFAKYGPSPFYRCVVSPPYPLQQRTRICASHHQAPCGTST
eukprot:1334704-Amorphochlora_amoeboformis.AAC.2